jgi:hypothetical protein
VRKIGVRERRARLAVRHGLAGSASSCEDAADRVVGLHSSDPVTVFLSAWARLDPFDPRDLEDALYERRSLVRMHGMRRTLFVVTREVAAMMHEACTKPRVRAERTRLIGWLEGQGIVRAGTGDAWVARVQAETLAAIAARGQATAQDLPRDVPDLGKKIRYGEGRTWAGLLGVSTRILFLLASEGRIVRTRPLGNWTSARYRYATVESWLGGPLPAPDPEVACAGLLRRWLAAYGPGTATDIRWWMGWSAGTAARTLEAVGAVEVELDEGLGYVLPDDVEPVRSPGPWAAVLPGLDPTIMGWKDRAWYVDDGDPRLFAGGNAGPSVWVNGQVVGAWVPRADGELVLDLFADVDARSRRRVETRRRDLRTWLGDVRFRSRVPAAFADPEGRTSR